MAEQIGSKEHVCIECRAVVDEHNRGGHIPPCSLAPDQRGCHVFTLDRAGWKPANVEEMAKLMADLAIGGRAFATADGYRIDPTLLRLQQPPPLPPPSEMHVHVEKGGLGTGRRVPPPPEPAKLATPTWADGWDGHERRPRIRPRLRTLALSLFLGAAVGFGITMMVRVVLTLF